MGTTSNFQVETAKNNHQMKKIISLLVALLLINLSISSCVTTAKSKSMQKQSLSVSQGMNKQQVLSIMGDSPTTRDVKGAQEVWIYTTAFANWATLEEGYTHQIFTFVGGRLAAINNDKTYGSTSYKDCWVYEAKGNRPDAILEIRNR